MQGVEGSRLGLRLTIKVGQHPGQIETHAQYTVERLRAQLSNGRDSVEPDLVRLIGGHPSFVLPARLRRMR